MKVRLHFYCPKDCFRAQNVTEPWRMGLRNCQHTLEVEGRKAVQPLAWAGDRGMSCRDSGSTECHWPCWVHSCPGSGFCSAGSDILSCHGPRADGTGQLNSLTKVLLYSPSFHPLASLQLLAEQAPSSPGCFLPLPGSFPDSSFSSLLPQPSLTTLSPTHHPQWLLPIYLLHFVGSTHHYVKLIVLSLYLSTCLFSVFLTRMLAPRYKRPCLFTSVLSASSTGPGRK